MVRYHLFFLTYDHRSRPPIRVADIEQSNDFFR